MYPKLLLILSLSVSQSLQQINVCRTFEDYLKPVNNPNCYYNPDLDLTAIEVIKKYMRRVEIYEIITDDGYILPLYRIPQPNPKGTVLLQHPLTTDSFNYVVEGRQSLVYLLWQNGYEIWLSNARGTRNSQHLTLDHNDYRFWNFSFHEIGYYDMPKIVELIRTKTNDSKMIYFGYSEGSVIAYIYASLHPQQAQESFSVFIVGGSCAIWTHTDSPAKSLAPTWPIIQKMLDRYEIGNLFAPLFVGWFRLLLRMFPILPTIVSFAFGIFAGWTTNTDPTFINLGVPALMSDVPTKSLLHFGQLILNKTDFRMYDYGYEGNLNYYQQEVPPVYPLENIGVPMFLITSHNDTLTSVKDTYEVYNRLSDRARTYGVLEIYGLNHMDFLTGRNRKEKFYDKVLDFIENKLEK